MIDRLRLYPLVALLSAPELASAHSAFKGANTFLNGLLHPVLVAGHLLLIVALGLLFGQQGLANSEKAITLFLAATVCGLLMSDFSVAINLEILLLTFALLTGLLVVIRPRMPVSLFSGIGIMAGFIIGLDSTQEGISGAAKAFALLGSAVGISVLLLYPVAIVDNFHKRVWQITGVRIIGSWIVASAFLVMTLSISRIST